MFVNEWFMPSVRVAAFFGSRAFAFGATIALRRGTLERIGGFNAIVDQLADDYRLGDPTRVWACTRYWTRTRSRSASTSEAGAICCGTSCAGCADSIRPTGRLRSRRRDLRPAGGGSGRRARSTTLGRQQTDRSCTPRDPREDSAPRGRAPSRTRRTTARSDADPPQSVGLTVSLGEPLACQCVRYISCTYQV